MMTKLDKNNYLQNYMLAKFYKDNYEAAEHLIPTEKQIKRGNDEFLLYMDEGEIVGATSYEYITPTLVNTKTTVIKKDRRGQGFGNALNEEVEKICRESKVNKIFSHIFVDNMPSIMLKLKRDWQFEARLNNHDGPGMDEYIMFKIL